MFGSKKHIVLKARVWHFDRNRFIVLEPEVTKFGGEGGVGEDKHCYASILIGSDWETEDSCQSQGSQVLKHTMLYRTRIYKPNITLDGSRLETSDWDHE